MTTLLRVERRELNKRPSHCRTQIIHDYPLPYEQLWVTENWREGEAKAEWYLVEHYDGLGKLQGSELFKMKTHAREYMSMLWAKFNDDDEDCPIDFNAAEDEENEHDA